MICFWELRWLCISRGVSPKDRSEEKGLFSLLCESVCLSPWWLWVTVVNVLVGGPGCGVDTESFLGGSAAFPSHLHLFLSPFSLCKGKVTTP